ncbi:MAG TPA: hypothetical protein VMQ76_10850 [Terracidiphilus sp.]|nr:hypothetical protein [Terracidiphilus sp.]
MSEEQHNDHAERLGKLETAVSGIWTVLDKLQKGQEEIQHTISDSGKTNWPVLIGTVVAVAGLLLSMAVVMYGAAIHPLNQDIERADKSAVVLADAVRSQDSKIVNLQILTARIQDHQEVVLDELKRFDKDGSAADKRLTVIEWQLAHATNKGTP